MNPLQQLLEFLQRVVTLNNFFVWDSVWGNLFNPAIIQGAILTVIVAVIAQIVGTLIGLLLYFMRRSNSRIARTGGGLYVWFFRGTPLIVQIYMLYLLFPYLNLARPLRANDVMGALGFTRGVGPVFLDFLIAALIALSLNEGAYMAEIVRAGIDSIDVGQLEAARSLGMTYPLAMRRIVLPQAFRVIIPPLGNEFNNMLKNVAQAAIIGLAELLSTALAIGGPQFRVLELVTVAAIWYLALTTIWGFIQAQIERKFNASNLDPSLMAREPWLQRMFGIRTRRPAPPPEPMLGH